MLIAVSEIVKLNAHIDFGGHYMDLMIERKSIQMGLEPDRTVNQMPGDKTKNDDFTM